MNSQQVQNSFRQELEAKDRIVSAFSDIQKLAFIRVMNLVPPQNKMATLLVNLHSRVSLDLQLPTSQKYDIQDIGDDIGEPCGITKDQLDREMDEYWSNK